MANNPAFPIASGLRRSGTIHRHYCYAKSEAGPGGRLAGQDLRYAKETSGLLPRPPFTPERVP
jgi:hypothetical protein